MGLQVDQTALRLTADSLAARRVRLCRSGQGQAPASARIATGVGAAGRYSTAKSRRGWRWNHSHCGHPPTNSRAQSRHSTRVSVSTVTDSRPSSTRHPIAPQHTARSATAISTEQLHDRLDELGDPALVGNSVWRDPAFETEIALQENLRRSA